ncbi:MAG: phosphoribosylglycinamide formyltransferase [Euryarchaeota archaeon]|jgi:formyltetrahydrofolate-dependent phosphoribosylglycinamide formyltransferase|nr:phosphoribosylglycinamide formyltransferase [Euryarchaeota archaeon]MBT4803308.1 phosphoribosylglycinamide formyltransferase [Euryarchaeota archaeon]MBT6873936.1 phosphoribosylglycinamide formyltransferase [Euryarchaeota archaeon]
MITFAVVFVEVEYILPRIASLANPLRVAVLISGTGAGLNSLLEHQKTSRTHSTKLILSNNNDAYGLIYGNKYNIKCKVIPLPHSSNKDLQRTMHEDLINQELINSNIELIVLNGYMRILTPSFVSKWKGRIINIHPSLLPKFPGAHAHRDVIKAKVSESGCTVHLVDDGVDTGYILAQEKVSVNSLDNIKSLQEKIKKVEHRLYPKVIDDISIGKYHIKS